MLRVSPGHYRDSFMRKTYDVFRHRGTQYDRVVKGWRYALSGGMWSGYYESKVEAAAAARREIANS